VDEREKQKETGRLIKYEEGGKQERDCSLKRNKSLNLREIQERERRKERETH
jgi:hypothetical protein